MVLIKLAVAHLGARNSIAAAPGDNSFIKHLHNPLHDVNRCRQECRWRVLLTYGQQRECPVQRNESGNMKVTYEAQHWLTDLIELCYPCLLLAYGRVRGGDGSKGPQLSKIPVTRADVSTPQANADMGRER